jgi:hypothetical protein
MVSFVWCRLYSNNLRAEGARYVSEALKVNQTLQELECSLALAGLPSFLTGVYSDPTDLLHDQA